MKTKSYALGLALALSLPWLAHAEDPAPGPANTTIDLKYWVEFAKQGNAAAQYGLGYRYANGQGVEHDDAQAVEWYEKAAAQGNAQAQYALAYMYSNGRGTEADQKQANDWYLRPRSAAAPMPNMP